MKKMLLVVITNHVISNHVITNLLIKNELIKEAEITMLIPKRTKYRKPHRVSYEGKAKGAKKVDFGEFGLMALDGA